jgi:hypothetical protein
VEEPPQPLVTHRVVRGIDRLMVLPEELRVLTFGEVSQGHQRIGGVFRRLPVPDGLELNPPLHHFHLVGVDCETTPHQSTRLGGWLVERRRHPRSVLHVAGADREAAAARDPSAPQPLRSALTSNSTAAGSSARIGCYLA